jgi:hypothetical protein
VFALHLKSSLLCADFFLIPWSTDFFLLPDKHSIGMGNKGSQELFWHFTASVKSRIAPRQPGINMNNMESRRNGGNQPAQPPK